MMKCVLDYGIDYLCRHDDCKGYWGYSYWQKPIEFLSKSMEEAKTGVLKFIKKAYAQHLAEFKMEKGRYAALVILKVTIDEKNYYFTTKEEFRSRSAILKAKSSEEFWKVFGQ